MFRVFTPFRPIDNSFPSLILLNEIMNTNTITGKRILNSLQVYQLMKKAISLSSKKMD